MLYVATTAVNLRKPSSLDASSRRATPWSPQAGHRGAHGRDRRDRRSCRRRSCGSLDGFVEQLGLSQFFVAAVIVALVGNAAEHGGAIVTARRGNSGLGAEIAVSSSTQVAVFVAPAIALLSGLVGRGLPLAFRPVEIATMAARRSRSRSSSLDAHAKRWEGIAPARRLRAGRRRVLGRRRR